VRNHILGPAGPGLGNAVLLAWVPDDRYEVFLDAISYGIRVQYHVTWPQGVDILGTLYKGGWEVLDILAIYGEQEAVDEFMTALVAMRITYGV